MASPYIYKEWQNKQLPADYGRELLGIDKYNDPAAKLLFQKRKYDETDSLSEEALFCNMEFHHVDGEAHRENDEESPTMLVSGCLELREQSNYSDLIGTYGMVRGLGISNGYTGTWKTVTPPGIHARESSKNYNPVFDYTFETVPVYTTPEERDQYKLEFGGELNDMNFKPSLYQHDPHQRSVMLPPWTFTNVQDCESSSRADGEGLYASRSCC